MNFEDDIPQRICNECKQEFDSSFDLVDHLLDEDEEFDPYIIMPNGYRLMVGSVLRFLFNNADKPEQIKLITETTYIALFAFENGFEFSEELIEDMVVKSSMQDFDEALKDLLNKGKNNEEGGA